ncbi:uncharacterized protein LTR77_001593 [Saxophila tyrrhenica]|uniref:Uncharacterized protein n=1 Tax=Saxophila tyrrhenica TaxID=1690608 RepID=A0AAV9PKJ0_9PEZI|nr:hypothetical protein LTR77_001593 [Saxophila tyrrhenica]
MAPTFDIRPYAEQHASTNGPGDARPTALQIIKDNDLLGKLSDKTILVTGGTNGIGLETVRQLAKTGAKVFFTARNEEKAKNVVQDLVEEGKTDPSLQDAKIQWVKMDQTSLQSVKEGAEEFLKRSYRLNVLVCNAGISQTPYAVTQDGFEAQFATNHLSHFYLFQLLKPLLLRSSEPNFNSRVVVVASAANALSTVQVGNYGLDEPPKEYYDPMCEMDGDHNPMILYGSSKTANIWFSNEIERCYGAKGLHSLSLHPGVILTAGFATLDPRVAEKLAALMNDESIMKAFKSVEQGAATQVLAAVGKDFEGKGGVYLDDCGVSQPLKEGDQAGISGYKQWIYDEEGQRRLWKDSLDMVGLKDEQ